MKKYLSILVIGLAIFLPIGAKAASRVNFSCEEKCIDNGDTCQKTCNVQLTGDSITIEQFKATLQLSEGVALQSVTAASGWTSLSSGNDLIFSANPAVTGTNINIATLVFNISKNGECSIVLRPTGYDTITVDVTVEQTVDTGVTLPLAIIACAAVAAGVVYYVSKKNTKMYKI